MLHNGPPHNSNNTYAHAKRMLEIQSRAYQENYDKDFICIIPTNIYGPYDNYYGDCYIKQSVTGITNSLNDGRDRYGGICGKRFKKI